MRNKYLEKYTEITFTDYNICSVLNLEKIYFHL
jgi:hypothetical protein